MRCRSACQTSCCTWQAISTIRCCREQLDAQLREQASDRERQQVADSLEQRRRLDDAPASPWNPEPRTGGLLSQVLAHQTQCC